MDDSFEDELVPEMNDAEVEQILREALKIKIADKRKTPRNIQLRNALVGSMGEFLSCFKLIAYDLDGNPISMCVHKSNLEKSALDNAFMEEISRFMSSKMG